MKYCDPSGRIDSGIHSESVFCGRGDLLSSSRKEQQIPRSALAIEAGEKTSRRSEG
jgi:hypothetical protein